MKNTEKLSDYAHDKLKSLILSNHFTPGQHLEEVALCNLLEISRTPLREAISRLVYENLLIAVPKKGIFVPELGIQATAELFRARKLIEPMIMMLSAPHLDKDIMMDFRKKTVVLIESESIEELHRLDYDFHAYITDNCGNVYIKQAISQISDQFQRVRTQDFYPSERALKGAKEHIGIIDKVVSGDFEALPNLMLAHITSTETYYYKKLLENDTAEHTIAYLQTHMADLK